MVVVKSVGLRELRQNASELVREVEDGGVVEVTVAGRLAARLVSAVRPAWRAGVDLDGLFSGRGDPDWVEDREAVADFVVDPWGRA